MNLRDGIWWTMDWDLSIYEHAAVAHALMAWLAGKAARA